METLDRIGEIFRWQGIEKELVQATIDIRNNVMPTVHLLLQIYKMFFEYSFKRVEVTANPGLYRVIIYGQFKSSIGEIGEILRHIYKDVYWIESGFNIANEKHRFHLTIKHTDGYSFVDESESWEI